MTAQGQDAEDLAEYIPFEEFAAGVGAGRFRVVVDPRFARPYISQRLMLSVLTLPVIGTGVGLALLGHTWIGAALALTGVGVNRLIRWQAPRLLLYIASRDKPTYEFATQNGLLEVRRR